MTNAVFLDQQSLYPSDLSFEPWQSLAVNWTFHPGTTPEQIHERLKNQHIVVTNKVVITEEHLANHPQIKCLVVSATGVNNVDIEAAAKRGIPVCNVRAYGTSAVAQHTFSLLLNLTNKITQYQNDLPAKTWCESDYFCDYRHPLMELAGKTMGIVGYGELGKAVGELAKAFDMKVLIAARDSNDTRPDRTPMHELVAQADVVSLHCPLTAENQGMINADLLKTMKSSAFLINTARGGLVNETDLVNALKAGDIAGAASDVASSEPPLPDNVLLNAKLPNLLVTPHIAWASTEARQRMANQVAHLVEAFLNGAPEHVVNL